MIYKRFMLLPNTSDAHTYACSCVFIFPAEQQDLYHSIMQKDKWITCYLKNYDMYRKQHSVNVKIILLLNMKRAILLYISESVPEEKRGNILMY